MPQRWDENGNVITGPQRWDEQGNPVEAPKPTGGAASRFVGGALQELNPVSILSGMAQAARHPIDTLSAALTESGENMLAIPETVRKEGVLSIPKAVVRSVPMVGPHVAGMMEQAESGDVAGGVGRGFGFGLSAVVGGKIAKRIAAEAPLPTLKQIPENVRIAGEEIRAIPARTAAAARLIPDMPRRAAVSVAESSLGVTNTGRGFGKTPGEAVLSETTGMRPEKVLASTKGRLANLGEGIEAEYRAAGAAGRKVSLNPALKVIDDEIAAAKKGQNESLLNALTKQRERLVTDLESGNPLGPDVLPDRMWAIKRNWGNDTNWNANVDPKLRTRIDREVYRAMDSELDRVAPRTAEWNQRYSSLTNVRKRADITSRNERLPGAVMDRIARRTGGLALAAGGYVQGGIPGAIVGLLTPEVVANPAVRMGVARGLYRLGGGRKVPPVKPPILLP